MKGDRRLVLGLTAAALMAIAWSAIADVRPALVYNASPSVPLGFYRVEPPAGLRRSELILMKPPESMRGLIAERGYLPPDTPLIKRVAALPGDHVCAMLGSLYVDGSLAVEDIAGRDSLGRPLPVWSGCRRLQTGDVFTLMAGVPNSLDGRYFGPVAQRTLIGRLTPLWTF